jgi:hypothetical protein
MADHGITFKTYSPKGEGRSPQGHYRCDPFEEPAKLPVADFVAENCFLFLWIPPLQVQWQSVLLGEAEHELDQKHENQRMVHGQRLRHPSQQ